MAIILAARHVSVKPQNPVGAILVVALFVSRNNEEQRDATSIRRCPRGSAQRETAESCRGNPCGCPVRQPEQRRAAGCNVDPQMSTRIGGFQREPQNPVGATLVVALFVSRNNAHQRGCNVDPQMSTRIGGFQCESAESCRGNPCGCPVRQPEQRTSTGCNVDPQMSTRIGGFQCESAESCRGNPCGCPVRQPEQRTSAVGAVAAAGQPVIGAPRAAASCAGRPATPRSGTTTTRPARARRATISAGHCRRAATRRGR